MKTFDVTFIFRYMFIKFLVECTHPHLFRPFYLQFQHEEYSSSISSREKMKYLTNKSKCQHSLKIKCTFYFFCFFNSLRASQDWQRQITRFHIWVLKMCDAIPDFFNEWNLRGFSSEQGTKPNVAFILLTHHLRGTLKKT